MTNILALDISLLRAGVARIRSAGTETILSTETVVVPPCRVPGAREGTMRNEARVGAARLKWWHDFIVEAICDYDYYDLTPTIAVEQLAYSERIAETAKLYGVIELACYIRYIPLVYVQIKTIKLHATGHGDCDKQRMVETAVAKWGDMISNEHEADAAWMADYVLKTQGGNHGK